MLNNKIALVTGASRGIGKAIVLSLINANVQVIGTSLNKKKLDSFNNSLSIDQKNYFIRLLRILQRIMILIVCVSILLLNSNL